MSALTDFVEKGGLVLVALIPLAVMLYERCFQLIIRLHLWRKKLKAGNHDESGPVATMEEFFERQLITIRTLTTTAPLLGLLGTVVGILQVFGSMTSRYGERSIQDLADGISMALITTETGLSIAIPALLLVSWAERQLNKGIAEEMQ